MNEMRTKKMRWQCAGGSGGKSENGERKDDVEDVEGDRGGGGGGGEGPGKQQTPEGVGRGWKK